MGIFDRLFKPGMDAEQTRMLRTSSRHSPDAWELELKHYHLLFVADELKTGFRCHSYMENGDTAKVCVAYTTRTFNMCMIKHGQASYPLILPSSVEYPGPLSRAEAAVVKGELYICHHRQILRLDTYKENCVQFTRERVMLDIPHRQKAVMERTVVTVKTTETSRSESVHTEDYEVLGEWEHYTSQDAWMYIAKPEYHYWSQYSDNNLRVVRPRTPNDRNLRPFYDYRPSDDQPPLPNVQPILPRHVSVRTDQTLLKAQLAVKHENKQDKWKLVE